MSDIKKKTTRFCRLRIGDTVGGILSDRDASQLLRCTSAAARPLSGIQPHTAVIFFSAPAGDFSVFTVSHFLEIMRSLGGVLALLAVWRWVS